MMVRLERRTDKMKKRAMLLITAVLSVLLFPMVIQAKYQVGQPIPIGINSLEKMVPNGEFSVYLFQDAKWQKLGNLTFDRFFRERKIDLGNYISNSETVKIRILQTGGGAAHIDAIFLGELSPAEVDGIKDSIALKKLSQKDYDVIDAYGKDIEVTFSAKGKGKELTLIARVENQNISKIPFQFPVGNLFKKMDSRSEFYTYTIDSKNESDAPFFKEYSQTGSGHPSGFTYGWVNNDDKNLYVKIDFTPDNTMDGEKDYAKVYVKTEKGLKEFKVSVPEKKWGTPDFIYTDKVAYQHKVYDFKIPFADLGIDNMKDRKNLSLAFSAYGTAAPGAAYASDLAFDSANNNYLAVFAKDMGSDNYNIYGQLLKSDGTTSGGEINIYTGSGYMDVMRSPKVAYDSENARFLVVWSLDNTVYGRIVNANGTFYGTSITITDNNNAHVSCPQVAYDNVNSQYLVVWHDGRNSAAKNLDIYGQFVNANGSKDGSNLAISSYAEPQNYPSVAFDSTNEMFLVVWQDARNTTIGGLYITDIYGQLVDADTQALEGVNFIICNADTDQQYPQVSNDSTNGRFLVVWQDPRNSNGDIYGILVDADDGTLGLSEICISDDPKDQYYPEAVYDSENDKFLAVWRDDRNGGFTDIYGQCVNANGTINGDNFAVAESSTLIYDLPQIDFNPNNDPESFLVLYRIVGNTMGFSSTLITPPCSEECMTTLDLIADGGSEESAVTVGTVAVSSTDGGLTWTVTYETTGSWEIKQIHLDVACDLADIPQIKDNPIPGKFDYDIDLPPGTTSHTIPNVQPMNADGEVCSAECIVFAAYAKVVDIEDCKKKGCREEGAWAEGSDFSGKTWATYFELCCGGTEEGFCDDGVDNDCDGYTDCDDSDCANDPVCGNGDCISAPEDYDPDCVGYVQEFDSKCCGTEWDQTCEDEYAACMAPGDEKGLCDDGINNDLDEQTDCYDLDCVGDQVCTYGECPNDKAPDGYNSVCVAYVSYIDAYCCDTEWDEFCEKEYAECIEYLD